MSHNEVFRETRRCRRTVRPYVQATSCCRARRSTENFLVEGVASICGTLRSEMQVGVQTGSVRHRTDRYVAFHVQLPRAEQILE